MTESELKSVQVAQLNILKSVLEVLNNHQLQYIAVGGTALGAYRHQGFIPWDDDIDIAMPRKDYDAFLKLQNELPSGLFIQHASTDPHYPMYFMKVRQDDTLFREKRFQRVDMHHGIFIDIFPLDNLENITASESKLKKAEKRLRHCELPLKKWLNRLKNPLKSKQDYFNDFDKIVQQHNNKSTEVVGYIEMNDHFQLEKLWPAAPLPFEDIEIMVPKDITGYLENKYGDYMRIPEVHERRTHNVVELKL